MFCTTDQANRMITTSRRRHTMNRFKDMLIMLKDSTNLRMNLGLKGCNIFLYA